MVPAASKMCIGIEYEITQTLIDLSIISYFLEFCDLI